MITFYIFYFLIGLVLGSFANVCICRIPANESIVFPRSRCPNCRSIIKWFQNVPVLSYLFLKGKCSNCAAPISIQYPLIELATGTAFLLLSFHYPVGLTLLQFSFFTLILIIISGIDYRHQVIPDILSYTLVISGLLFSVLNQRPGLSWQAGLLNSVSGAATGAVLLYLITILGKKAFKKDAMGAGDIKLLAGIGAYMGPKNTVFVLLLGSILGSIIGLSLIFNKKIEKRDYLPFGPFLSISAYIIIFISQYLSILF